MVFEADKNDSAIPVEAIPASATSANAPGHPLYFKEISTRLQCSNFNMQATRN